MISGLWINYSQTSLPPITQDFVHSGAPKTRSCFLTNPWSEWPHDILEKVSRAFARMCAYIKNIKIAGEWPVGLARVNNNMPSIYLSIDARIG